VHIFLLEKIYQYQLIMNEQPVCDGFIANYLQSLISCPLKEQKKICYHHDNMNVKTCNIANGGSITFMAEY
jgi:hypothetical protein